MNLFFGFWGRIGFDGSSGAKERVPRFWILVKPPEHNNKRQRLFVCFGCLIKAVRSRLSLPAETFVERREKQVSRSYCLSKIGEKFQA